MEEIKIERLLRSIGIATFLDYFQVYRFLNKQSILESFAKGNEDWTKLSFSSRSSHAMKIFRNNKEKEALEYICGNCGKISQMHKDLAKYLLDKISRGDFEEIISKD